MIQDQLLEIINTYNSDGYFGFRLLWNVIQGRKS